MKFSTCGAVGTFAAFASMAILIDGCGSSDGYLQISAGGTTSPMPSAPTVETATPDAGAEAAEAGADSKANSLACNDVWERTHGANALDTELSAPSGSVPEILEFINQARSSTCTCGDQLLLGAGPLTWNKKLEAAAQKHSEWMAKSRTFDHTGRNKSSPGDRVKAAGYRFSSAGENIGLGYGSAAVALLRWLASPEHCKNIMNPDFSELGVAYVQGLYPDDPKYAEVNAAGTKASYWTMVLATPKGSQAPKKK